MICMQTRLKIADNTGAKEAMCIKVLGGSQRRFAGVGDVIVISIKSAIPRSKIKEGDVHRAVIVRSVKGVSRKDGSVMNFNENAVVLLSKNGEPIGTRIFGPVPRELRKNYIKIVSLAPEVY